MTSHTSAIDSYLKRVTRELICFHSTKKRFTAGLKQEFCEQPEEADPVRVFGEPGALAASLQDDIPPDEEAAARRRRKRLIALGALVTVVIFAVLTVCIVEVLRSRAMWVVETIFDVEHYTV